MNDELKELIGEINNAFYKLESYMDSRLDNYRYFGFDSAFTKLFKEAEKNENYSYDNCILIGRYWKVLEQIRYDHDQGDYDNLNALNNNDFNKDCEEISYLAWDRIEDFDKFTTADEKAEEEKKFSITDVINFNNWNTQKRPKQQTKTSYIWQGNPDDELPELYSLLTNEYKLISPETTQEQFTAIFTRQSIDNIKPIKWHQNNATELLYFIIRLEQLNNIVHNPKRADYTKLKACFVDPDGQEFKAKWKSLKTHIEINLSPEKQNAIDELVKQF